MFSEDNPMRKERKYLWHVNGERLSKFFLGIGKLIGDKHQFLVKRWEYQITLPASWEIYMQDKKQELEPDMDNH